jgi:hypothetical protein
MPTSVDKNEVNMGFMPLAYPLLVFEAYVSFYPLGYGMLQFIIEKLIFNCFRTNSNTTHTEFITYTVTPSYVCNMQVMSVNVVHAHI